MTYADTDLAGLANPLQGTDSTFDLSRGNTLPLVARPWGMTHWTPQSAEGNWLFRYGDAKLQGIRATHQPSPWIGDYGWFTVMPIVGEVDPRAGRRASGFRPDRFEVRPDYLSVVLARYETRLEFTPTVRCGVFRFTFPETSAAGVLIQPGPGAAGVTIDVAKGRITGFTRSKTDGVPENFALYFAATFDAPLASGGVIRDNQPRLGEHAAQGEAVGAAVRLAPLGPSRPVTMRVATSFISVEQAELNLDREVGARGFDAVRDEAQRDWNERLGRIAIDGGSDIQRRTFYSALYRSLLFPRQFHEPDARGNVRHYSPYDGKVHPGVLYTDNGFWDTYRTVYPLLALAYPDRLGEILTGWINGANEGGGWFPKWASPGYRNCMIGTHIDSVMADAVVKGVEGFDHAEAYRLCRRNATEPGPEHRKWGRFGLQHYIERGYVPSDLVEHGTSRTLEFAYNDACVAAMAERLGHQVDAELFRKRSQNYRNVYDASVGFMRGRNADGSWMSPFDPFEWGGPFIEGCAWQFTWNVPHDPQGLIALLGGREKFVAKLEAMLAAPPTFRVGAYGFEIHEMTEVALADFGQYAHSNQPVHHVLYLFAEAGRPDLMRRWVRRVLDEMYRPTPDGLPGDEDNGEMSAWYVLSALGLFSLCPGQPDYTLGRPLFPKATVHRPRALTVERGGDASGMNVSAISWQGKAVEGHRIGHNLLDAGGTLRFEG